MTALEQKVADIINVTLGESLELNGSEFLDWPQFNEDSLKVEPPVSQRDRIARNAAIYTVEKIAQALAVDLNVNRDAFYEACTVAMPQTPRAKKIAQTIKRA